jgi:hypothetical protein
MLAHYSKFITFVISILFLFPSSSYATNNTTDYFQNIDHRLITFLIDNEVNTKMSGSKTASKLETVVAKAIDNCPGNITLSAGASCTAVATWTVPTSDVGNDILLTSALTSGDLFPLGTTTVTYEERTNPGNNLVSTCTFDVIVEDTTDPVTPRLPDVTVDCNGLLTAPTTFDACAGFITGTTSDTLNFVEGGSTIITWTFNDGNGNSTRANQVYNYDDTTNPITPSLPDVTVDCNGRLIAPTTTDACAGSITGTTSDTLNFVESGSTTITWTFNDGNGNSTTANQIYNYDDTTDPIIPVLSAITIDCNGRLIAPIATDACAGTIIGTTSDTLNFVEGSSTTITWTFNDGNGNSTTANQIYNYDDTTDPVTPRLPDVTVDCNGFVTAPTTTDACAGSITGTTSDTLNFVEGSSTTITWTFNDGNGNSTTANQIYNYDDTTDPITPRLPDVTVDCNELLTAPTTTDACAGSITGITSDTLNFVEGSSTTITWTFNDGNGNSTTANQVYNYDDTTDPITPILSDVIGQCSATPVSPTTSDNCSGTITGTTSTRFPITSEGTTIVIWTFDDGNGNIINVNQNVIIIDTTPPTTVCQNITITLDAFGNASISNTDIDNGSTDNCGIQSLSLDNSAFDCSNLGVNIVTLTVRDLSNNVSTCTATVTVVDPAAAATVSIVANESEICQGENVIFSVDSTVDSGAIPIYDWYINGVSFGTNSSTFTPVSPLNNGDQVYVLMQSSLSSCPVPKQSNIITTIVNPLPLVSGPTDICIDSTGNLTPATSGWVSTSGFASVDDSGVVTPISAGIGTFTYTDANGCSSDFSLLINNLPIISNLPNGNTICVNETHNLSANSGGSWSSSNTNATISGTGEITGVSAGNVTFTFTDSNGCSATSVSIEILAIPTINSVTASDTPVCAGDPSILTANVQSIGNNAETIVNYNFNETEPNNYNDFDGQEVTNITSEVIQGNNMPLIDRPGTVTDELAFTTELIDGRALMQKDNNGNNDEGSWIFNIGGTTLNTYQGFSIYFQTKRKNPRGDNKSITVSYRLDGTGSFIIFGTFSLINNDAARAWQEAIFTLPDLVNNPGQLEIEINVSDGYTGNQRGPDVFIDNFQVSASTVEDTNLYSWTGNTGADAGLPIGSDTPSTANNLITVNPEITTEYTLTVTNSDGCPETEQVTVNVFPTPEITILADYCPADDPSTEQDESNMVKLVASSNIPITDWTWLTDPEQTGDTIYVDIAGFYQVVGVSDDGCSASGTTSVAQELVIDGDFTNLNIMDNSNYPFTSGHIFVPNQPGLVPANRGELWNDRVLLGYTITNRGDDVHKFFKGTDHTQNAEGPQNFMVVNGDAGIPVWRQDNTTIQPSTTYYFSAWVMRCINGNPPELVFNINGEQVGSSITPPERDGPDLINNNWVRFYGNWTSGENDTSVDISIQNLNNQAGGNDYGIDDISFGTLSTFIRLTSAIGTDDSQVICQNDAITDITYDIGGGLTAPDIEWYFNNSETSLGFNVLPNGLTSSFNGLEYTITGIPTDFGVYDYVLSTSSDCANKQTLGTLTVNEAPIVDIEDVTSPICYSQGSISVSAILSGTAVSRSWSTSGSGNFTSISGDGTNAIYNFGTNETGTVTLTFTSNNPTGPCDSAIDTLDIEITPFVIAEAGSNIDNSSSNCADLTATLAANNSVGTWTVTSPQDPSTYYFSDAMAYNSQFTGESGEIYILQWEVSNTSPCSNPTDTMTVTFANCGDNIIFDGSEDHISFGNNYGLDNSAFSLEAWIKTDNIIGTKTIISKRNSNNLNSGYDLSLIGNRIYFRWNANGNEIFANQIINTTKWYHVAVTFSGSNYKMYIDGFEVLNSTAGTAPIANNNKALIGAMDTTNNLPINYFDGAIDEVRFWDITLTQTQIQNMMNQEIEDNDGTVSGVVVPLNISGDLQWDNLIGYYQMRFGPQTVVANGNIQDISTISAVQGKLNGMTEVQEETAPIPYISRSNDAWDNQMTWLDGTVQQIPNSTTNSVNGLAQTWNIVRSQHNITSRYTKPTQVLGLLVDNNKLSIIDNQPLIIDKYFKLMES